MFRTYRVGSVSMAIAVAITGLVIFEPAPASGQDTACARSASDMRRSCAFEVLEEYKETIANCRQLPTSGERSTCKDDALDERGDARAECRGQLDARLDACDLLDENRYADPLLDEGIEFIDPDDVPSVHANNPYVILEAGHTFVLRAGDEFEEIVIVHVTDEVREIQDVLCRVVADVAVEVGEDEDDGDGDEPDLVDYEAVEVTDDWFAQDVDANVYYCGEVARNFEDGVLRDLDGSFESGIDFAMAGVLTLAAPAPGDIHRQEYSLGEAEDLVEYEDLAAIPTAEEGGENPAFPCAPDGCLRTFDFSPLEPESTELKYYLAGTGFVLAVDMEDEEFTGEREELVCVGDSLDILMDESCGIEDPIELLDDLCEVHPEAFCEDDEE